MKDDEKSPSFLKGFFISLVTNASIRDALANEQGGHFDPADGSSTSLTALSLSKGGGGIWHWRYVQVC
jgi:hypothetical protein